jgi:hypothetical protein
MTLFSNQSFASAGGSQSWRDRILLLAALLCATMFALALARLIMIEKGGTNSFALVADSLLHARPFVTGCFDLDCATHDGKTYVIFPPFPGVVAMPLVAAFGTNTSGFFVIAATTLVISMLLWARILRRLDIETSMLVWLLLAIACASPLLFVTLRSNTVWFFAQAVAFPLVTFAIHEIMSKRLIVAGFAIGLAFLCRQMSIFYAPILLVMAFSGDEPLFRVNRERIVMALKLGLPVIAALCVYFLYNVWRFGSALDTGYTYMVIPEGMLKSRVSEYGIWNSSYFVFNAFYLFFQGFHAEFAEPMKLKLTGLDDAGTSILSASPWLLYLFFTPLRRVNVLCGLLIVGLSTVTLFYHSNGLAQYNTQRYILDWLPAALLMLASVFSSKIATTGGFDLFKPLVFWGIALNFVMLGVLTVVKA